MRFREIVVLFQQMAYSLSFRLLCDENEAKDVVRETFLKVWLNLPKYDEEKTFSTWNLYDCFEFMCTLA